MMFAGLEEMLIHKCVLAGLNWQLSTLLQEVMTQLTPEYRNHGHLILT